MTRERYTLRVYRTTCTDIEVDAEDETDALDKADEISRKMSNDQFRLPSRGDEIEVYDVQDINTEDATNGSAYWE